MRGLPPAAQLYVYYRVARARKTEAVGAAQALQQELAAHHPGLRCSVMRRADSGPEGPAESLTLMEVYRLEGGIGAALAAAIERAAQARLGHLVQGARHVEVFLPCA